MKVYRFFEKVLALALLCLCSSSFVLAQSNTSAASVSRARANVSSGTFTPPPATTSQYPSSSGSYTVYSAHAPVFKVPDEIVVDEFINYHKHRLPLPKAGQSVAMDTRWGSGAISRWQREAVLQIGFTTAEVNERTDLRPLNLVLVIDKSGSMAGDKMARVKSGLHAMIGRLRGDDIISIVAFDSMAEVLYPARTVGDGYAVRRAIDCLEPNGSTNLHGGLMLGYAEAKKHLRSGATNRVILLTDGIANEGVVDPGRIAAESSEFNGQGVDLSTIGVGNDLNNDLLRTLARSGRGLYHFISDYKDIDKVFVNEVQSLISSIAKRVEVRIEYGAGLQLEKIYGYEPRHGNGSVSIKLDDMNNGLTQVVMAKFRADSVKSTTSVKVRLSYYDVRRKCMVEEVQEARLVPAESESCELLTDVEVKKNYTIAQLADSLLEMTGLARRGRYSQALNALDTSAELAYRRYPNMEDGDIRFILDIVEGYRRDLRVFNQHSRHSDCGGCRQ